MLACEVAKLKRGMGRLVVVERSVAKLASLWMNHAAMGLSHRRLVSR